MAKETMASILDAFIADAKLPKKCKAQRWIATLVKEDQDKFNSLKDENRKVDIKNLYDALVNAGVNIPVKLTAFRSHFKGYCTCQK
jgi:hypothetical protein